MDIRTMPAGPELDAELARALGWDEIEMPFSGRPAWVSAGVIQGTHKEFTPSTTWEGAGQVIEEMQRRGWEVGIETHPNEAHVRFYKPDGDYAEHSGQPGELLLAITIAAILALRGESSG